jgi:hypothetical protein
VTVGTRAAERARLAEVLARVEAEAAPAPAVEGHDPRLGEKLRALGYVD